MRKVAFDGFRSDQVLTFAVMPCLNEAAYVREAATSLLAPACGTSSIRLVAVDNGSTDGTLDVLSGIRRDYPGRVHIVEEPRRGFVPPRKRGVAEVASLCRSAGAGFDEVLVLQADADTIYRPGYVPAMELAGSTVRNAVLEGAASRPIEFATAHPDYVRAERLVDSEVEHLEAVDEDDVVVDDKICAFHLSDYVRWGGLFQEVDSWGDEVHAETTRMFIRAKLTHGATKRRVNPAGAASSRRRVTENPRYHFATAGFPRGVAWMGRTGSRWSPIGVDLFAREVLSGGEEEAVGLRRAHLMALFRYLPAVVLSAAGASSDILTQPDVLSALSRLPVRSPDEVAARPGAVIGDVLGLIESSPDLFAMRR